MLFLELLAHLFDVVGDEAIANRLVTCSGFKPDTMLHIFAYKLN